MLLCRKLALFDEWNSLAVYVSMDNTVVIEDISESSAGLPSRVVGYRGSSLPFRTCRGKKGRKKESERERERERINTHMLSLACPSSKTGEHRALVNHSLCPFFLFPFSFLKGVKNERIFGAPQ